jgi:signal transduction histidine kinase
LHPGPLADKLSEQSDLMRDQMQYYLDRARAATRAATIGTMTEIDPVLDSLMRAFEKIYHDRAIQFAVFGEAGLRFRGEKQDFEELIGNLIDNAGKWSQSRVEISVMPGQMPETGHLAVLIQVDDDGPGIAQEKRIEATKRGRRLDETRPGSGLGLSIVVDMASIYGGQFSLHDSPLGGARAQLILPAV